MDSNSGEGSTEEETGKAEFSSHKNISVKDNSKKGAITGKQTDQDNGSHGAGQLPNH